MKRKLVEAIIAASFAMPDVNTHRAWLLGLDEGVLRSRLERLEQERDHPPSGAGLDWRKAARRKEAALTLAETNEYDPSI
jgi:hypothetical protein